MSSGDRAIDVPDAAHEPERSRAASAQVAGAALHLEHVSKAFSGGLALDDVDIELRRGEIHALVGQNGSGKSTLIKILAGFHDPEEGAEARVDDVPFELGNAAAAHAASVRFIHQDLALIGALNAVDNLALGESYGSKYWLSDREEHRRAAEIFGHYGVDVDLRTPITLLNRVEQTMVAIVRALHHQRDPRGILVLDEPTAAFTHHDTERLFALMRRVAQNGGTVLFVTHYLDEVFEIADRVTVLRDGRRVTTCPVTELMHDDLVTLIVGRPVEAFYPAPARARDSECLLEIKQLGGGTLDQLDLRLHAGEIVGLTGLKDSGADEALHLTFGSRPRSSGEVLVGDRRIGERPNDAIRAGVAFAPADRKEQSGFLTWTSRENITLPRVRAKTFLRWVAGRAERADAATWLKRLAVVPDNTESMFSELSGGNQQKVVMTRWLRYGARVFLIEEPTQGVDVGARHTIYEALRAMADDGAAILISSSDANEVSALCHRVIVMRDGHAAAELEGATNTVELVMQETIREERP